MGRPSTASSIIASPSQLGGVASRGLGCAIPWGLTLVIAAASGPSVLSWWAGGLDRYTARGGIVGGRSEAEDMYCVRGGRDTEKGGAEVEGHAIYLGRVGASPELVELLAPRHREYPDDGTRLAGSSKERAVVVETEAAEGRSMGFYHVHGLNGNGIEDEDPARRRCYVGGLGGSMGRSPGVRFLARFGERVGEIAIL